MRILVQLSHPAQFHFYKNIVGMLKADGHEVHVLIKHKDILEDLLRESGLPYVNIMPHEGRRSKLGMALAMLRRTVSMVRYARRNKIDVLTGAPVEVAYAGKVLRRRSIVVGEDDAAVIPRFISLARPVLDVMLSPEACNMGVLEPRVVHYAGYHKLAYLHPSRFVPDRGVVERYFQTERPYFILRFAKLNAHHDIDAHATGISTEVARRLVAMLSVHGNIYITAERELEPEFEQYRLNINPLDIHHVLAFATLYIGDSQSMAVEAAMLGVPSVRFNDFAGRIGVLEELEHRYGLTYGIASSQPRRLYDKVAELLAMPNLRTEFEARRQKMLAEKIDVAEFVTHFIENYGN